MTSGELWARGYFTMLGYFDKPDETAETLRADGWLRTGDLATMDERGYCRIVGRLKDMIIRGGENLFPAEIEEVLYRHPAVAEVAVVGLPDEKWGEVVAAFIRPGDPPSPPTVAELRAHLRAHLSPQKTPDQVVPRRRASRSPARARSRSSPSAKRGRTAPTPTTSSDQQPRLRLRRVGCLTGHDRPHRRGRRRTRPGSVVQGGGRTAEQPSGGGEGR